MRKRTSSSSLMSSNSMPFFFSVVRMVSRSSSEASMPNTGYWVLPAVLPYCTSTSVVSCGIWRRYLSTWPRLESMEMRR